MLFFSSVSKPLTAVSLFNVFLHISVGSTATIPKPDGPYGVSLSTAKLVDNSRQDPFASDSRKRAIMVSMFYPSGLKEDCSSEEAPYMPPATAAFQDSYFSVSNAKVKVPTKKLTVVSRLLGFLTGHLEAFNSHFAIRLLDQPSAFKTFLW